jgi:hypothetical protein
MDRSNSLLFNGFEAQTKNPGDIKTINRTDGFIEENQTGFFIIKFYRFA